MNVDSKKIEAAIAEWTRDMAAVVVPYGATPAQMQKAQQLRDAINHKFELTAGTKIPFGA